MQTFSTTQEKPTQRDIATVSCRKTETVFSDLFKKIHRAYRWLHPGRFTFFIYGNILKMRQVQHNHIIL